MTPEQAKLLERIDRRGRRHTLWLVAIAVWLAVLTAAVFGQSSETLAAARQDRQQFPPSQWGYFYYLTTDCLPETKQLTAGRTTAFVVSSFSRSVVLEQHLPVEVQRGLWRIDLRGLQWDWRDWLTVISRYPYQPETRQPLVVRSDWLTLTLTDNFESDAGYRLLYGGKQIPKTRDDFLRLWGVQAKATDPLLLAHIENNSGVSLLHLRRVENRPVGNRGYLWGTEDNEARNFSAKTDPLENLLGNRKHDAEEWIVGFPKLSVDQGAGGAAQAYLLANGQGARQDVAPVRIVRDHTNFRGFAEIRNTSSCIVCHAGGIIPLGKNDLRETIAAGVDLYADKKSQQLIEQQYLAQARLKIEAARNQEDYATFVALVTGWSGEENVRAYRALVDSYDAPLTLETAARELYTTPQELTNALAYASAKNIKLGARLASLAHGGTVERHYWESQYSVAYGAVQLWKTVGR